MGHNVLQVPTPGHEGLGGQDSGYGILHPKKVKAIFLNVAVARSCDHTKIF